MARQASADGRRAGTVEREGAVSAIAGGRARSGGGEQGDGGEFFGGGWKSGGEGGGGVCAEVERREGYGGEKERGEAEVG